jgi:hypothetical protein
MNEEDGSDVFIYSYWRTLRKCKTTVASVLLIREGNRVTDSGYQYRNVSECSHFHRHVIQVFKDFVAEGCGLYEFIAEAVGE